MKYRIVAKDQGKCARVYLEYQEHEHGEWQQYRLEGKNNSPVFTTEEDARDYYHAYLAPPTFTVLSYID